MRIVYLGTAGPLSTGPLEALLGKAIVPCAVIAARLPSERRERPGLEPAPPPRSDSLPLLEHCVGSSVLSLAWKHGIDAYEVGRLGAGSSLDRLAALEPDLLCVSCFPEILSARTLALPTRGAINVHPSLLPAYRGPAPLFWILRDAAPGGVSVHRMDRRIDAGPILAQAPLERGDGDSRSAIEAACGLLGGRLLLDALARLEAGPAEGTPQQEGDASQFGYPRETDWQIDADRPARAAFNFIRALARPHRPVRVLTGGQVLLLGGALGFDGEERLEVPWRPEGGQIAIRFSPGVLWASLDLLQAEPIAAANVERP